MITTIIILAYIANVFIARHLNYLLYKKNDEFYYKRWGVWFIPIAPVIAFTIILLGHIKIKKNWFTGKYW